MPSAAICLSTITLRDVRGLLGDAHLHFAIRAGNRVLRAELVPILVRVADLADSIPDEFGDFRDRELPRTRHLPRHAAEGVFQLHFERHPRIRILFKVSVEDERSDVITRPVGVSDRTIFAGFYHRFVLSDFECTSR